MFTLREAHVGLTRWITNPTSMKLDVLEIDDVTSKKSVIVPLRDVYKLKGAPLRNEIERVYTEALRELGVDYYNRSRLAYYIIGFTTCSDALFIKLKKSDS